MAENYNTTPHKVWSGTIAFGLVSVPVAMYAAAREEKISFNQLHNACKTRLKQQPMHCPDCNTDVDKKDIVKGFEFSKGQFVTLSKEEIEAAEPESSRTLEISSFVPEMDVDPVYLESSFYLGVGEGGEKAYALIRQAMILKGMVGIAKLFYSGKEHIALVRPVPGGLMLHTLFWYHEVRKVGLPRLPEVSEKELAIAGQLVDALSSQFDPLDYRDQYRENILAVIERKKAGETITVSSSEVAKKPPVSDISSMLMASIQAAKSTRAVAGGIQ